MIMQRQFQQSKVFDFLEEPQIQFIDRVLAPSFLPQRAVPQSNCAEDRRDPTGAFPGVVDVPIVVQRQVLGLTVQKTVDFPQLQCSDKVVDVPVVQVVEWASSSWTRLLTCPILCTSCSSCSSSTVMDVPVITQRRVLVSRTVEVPQIQFTARVVDIPVVQERRVHSFKQCRVWRR